MTISADWFNPNNFHRSEHSGCERIGTDGSWIRWTDSDLFIGWPQDMNPMIDGPPQDKRINGEVDTVEKLLPLVKP